MYYVKLNVIVNLIIIKSFWKILTSEMSFSASVRYFHSDSSIHSRSVPVVYASLTTFYSYWFRFVAAPRLWLIFNMIITGLFLVSCRYKITMVSSVLQCVTISCCWVRISVYIINKYHVKSCYSVCCKWRTTTPPEQCNKVIFVRLCLSLSPWHLWLLNRER